MAEDDRYCLFETRYGTGGFAWTGNGVLSVHLPEPRSDADAHLKRRTGATAPAEPNALARQVLELLTPYFEGEPTDFTALPLDLAAMPAASRKVYDHVRIIPWGTLETYGQVAEAIGEPGGARAVGQAMGSNPIPVIIPCHRVVAANGRLGGFSAEGGNRTKARLLEMEKAQLRTPDDPQLSLL